MAGDLSTIRLAGISGGYPTEPDPESKVRAVVGAARGRSKFYEAVQRHRRTEAKLQPDSSVIQFLRSGKSTHPDEGGVQQEYNTMMKALRTGKGVGKAVSIAKSHLFAHQRALRPTERGTIHDPYPGQPEKNQRAASGFIRVLAALKKMAPYERLARPTK